MNCLIDGTTVPYEDALASARRYLQERNLTQRVPFSMARTPVQKTTPSQNMVQLQTMLLRKPR